MTNSDTKSFEVWLKEKLIELKTDEQVFGDYVMGILDSDDVAEEKKTALQEIFEGLVGEITEDQLNELIDTILNKWLECKHQDKEVQRKSASLDVNEHLAKLLDAQKLQATVKERVCTEEQRLLKEQILAQYYSQAAGSDGDDECNDDADADEADKKTTASNSLSGIEKNTNVQDVLQLQKERREQARMDSAAKKQKDKDDREKQKQLREEKKEKRKTVKSERRR